MSTSIASGFSTAFSEKNLIHFFFHACMSAKCCYYYSYFVGWFYVSIYEGCKLCKAKRILYWKIKEIE